MLSIIGVVSVDEHGRLHVGDVPVEQMLSHFIGKDVYLSVNKHDESEDDCVLHGDDDTRI